MVTNSDLNREIGEVKQLVIDINKHLEKLNGQVAINTKFRIIHNTIFKVASWTLGSGTVGAGIFMFIKYL